MRLTELKLQGFRNYAEQHIQFGDGVNILLGENAQGKTNALEAIYMLAMGKSHRGQKDNELKLWGQKHASIEGKVTLHQRDRTLKLEFSENGRRALVNGMNQTKMTDFIGHFQVVLFAPEDLQLVKGSPAVRRRFIDMELGQTHPKYLYHLSQYQRVLQQRNSLLKKPPIDWEYMSVFDEQLAEHGVEILNRRMSFLLHMKRLSNEVYQQISDHREQFSMRYICTTAGQSMDLPRQQRIEHYKKTLYDKRDQDGNIGYTTAGPHRDDLTFTLDNHNVQAFASQGQQRTIALALRLAEIDFIYDEIGDYPVLLLDDVLSELDDSRQKNLIVSMSQKVQTILTTTTLFQLGDDLKTRSRLFHVRSGIIQTEG